jgi:pyruvate ferredoxin oxidoreductase beta subunit
MDRFSVYVPKLLPKDEYFLSGRRSCQGCGKAIAARIACKAIGNSSIISGPVAQSRSPLTTSLTAQSYEFDDITYEDMTAALLAGVQQVNDSVQKEGKTKRKRLKKTVVGIDRRVFHANFLTLSRTFESSEDTLYLCFDNEPSLNVLIAHASPQAFNLAEVPHPASAHDVERTIREKGIPGVVEDAGFSYVATACSAYPFDYMEKVKKGLECKGNAFILVLTPCPTGWFFSPKLTVRVGLLAVKSGYFPLYEIEDGVLRITERIKIKKPLQEYLKMQGRFMMFPPALVAPMQKTVDEIYEELLEKESR